MSEQTKQLWYCEHCNHHGCVSYESRTDVFSVVQLIEYSHLRESPHCHVDITQIRCPRDMKALDAIVNQPINN